MDASWGLLGPILLQFFHKSATKTPNFILILWDRCPYFHSLGEDEEKKSWFIIKIISIFTFLSVSLYLFFYFNFPLHFLIYNTHIIIITSLLILLLIYFHFHLQSQTTNNESEPPALCRAGWRA